jgi:hypothetical protein
MSGKPEEDLSVEQPVPILRRKPVRQAPDQASVIHRLLVAHNCRRESALADRHRGRSAVAFKRAPHLALNSIKIEQGRRAEKPMGLDRRPASALRHVVEDRAIGQKFFKFVIVHVGPPDGRC